MAFYIVTRIKGPVLATGPGVQAHEMTVKNTENGLTKTYHIEIADEFAGDPDQWLQSLQDTYDLLPNDFGLE